jgi:hypothetical protein
MSAEKQLLMQSAKDSTRKAIDYLEIQATGAAKVELLNALATIEKIHKLAA